MPLCQFFRQSVSLFLASALITGAAADPLQSNCTEALEKGSSRLFKVNDKFEFAGLTPEGLVALKKIRDDLRFNRQIFEQEYLNLGSAYHAMTVARAGKLNMYIYGPPGAAKSAIVSWLMKLDDMNQVKTFAIQLHQLISEMALVGGQNLEAAKKGIYEANTKDSLVDATVGLLDEIDKASPAVLATLLSLLNERKALLGRQKINSSLETIFSTSNANLAELMKIFSENGQETTGPALLNRYQIKAMLYNWLSAEDRATLRQKIKKEKRLNSVAEEFPDVLKDKTFLKAREIDWKLVRKFSALLFDTDDQFDLIMNTMVDELRDDTFKAIRESEAAHMKNKIDEPFIYFPSADWNQRLLNQVPDIVTTSALLDFLESPLSDDQHLSQSTKKQIELGPLSLWRAFLVATTIGPGNAKFIFNPTSTGQKIDVDFNWSIDPNKARDLREQKLIGNLINEQTRFKQTFLSQTEKLQYELEQLATFAPKGILHGEEKKIPFEILLFTSKQGN